MKKKLVSMLLCLVMVVSMTVIPAQAAYSPKYTAEAETLYELGLFRGTGSNADGTPIFSLDRQATRIEGLVILIRLLGEESDALAFAGACPFTDVPAWAERYAAYAYEKGYTKGTSATTFSDGPLYSNAFLTFVLRALGYSDSAGDFSYNTACNKAAEIGIIGAGEYTDQTTPIYRDSCAKISKSALTIPVKNGPLLVNKLIEDRVLTETAVQKSGILEGSVSLPLNASKLSTDEIKKAFPDVAYVSYGSVFRDDSFAQADLSPRMLLLNDRNVQAYCMGETGNMRKLRGTSTIDIDTGIYATIITVLNEDLHLIGYCISPVALSNNELTFKACHLDASEELAQLKQEAAQIARNTPKFDQNLVWCEAFVSANDNEYTIGGCPAYLKFDEDKLPASMKDFAYYSTYSGGDAMNVSTAWYHKNMNYLVNSKDFSPIIARDQKVTVRDIYIENEGIIILYDENKEPIGYTHLTSSMVRQDSPAQ